MKYALNPRHLYFPILLVFVFVLNGCGSTQSSAQGPNSNPLSEPSADALRYEQLANLSSDESERAVYQYLAALSWYGEGFVDRAYFLFRGINAELLSPEKRIELQLTLAEYYRERGELATALELLEAAELQSDLSAYATIEQKSRWAAETANLSLLLGNYERAFRVYDFALSYSDRAELEQLRNGLWKSLTLADQIPAPPYLSNETPGWVELARINNQSSGTVSDQYMAYLLWQDRYYQHPARNNPPKSFAVLQEIAVAQRPRVAILLPLSGNLGSAGNAILDGYMSARTTSYRENSNVPVDPLAPTEIKVFDTQIESMTAIVRALEDENFDLVIGPLDKARVASYASIMPDIPTLALNSLPEGQDLSEKSILGLSLNVESEAVQAAVRALQEGHQSALVLVPNSSWGDRAGLAFSDFWKAEGGEIVEFGSYGESNTHAGLLESNLHVNESNRRKSDLQANLGKILEFTPRRRQDIDALFLAASPNQARQLKPMLAFFFAEDIPVYATSSLYSGYSDPKADRDLDGIQFSTMPWVLKADEPLRKDIASQFGVSASELRMQALGVDTYYLSQRLEQFLRAPDTLYRGVIGKLSKDPASNDLERKQIWARFSGGRARPIAP